MSADATEEETDADEVAADASGAGVITDAIINADALQQFIDTLTAVVDEARLHFDEDGVHVKTVDPGNISMVWADLDTEAFEAYDSPGRATIGVNLDRLDEKLSVANSGDLVTLSVDMETRMLDIQIRHIEQSVALIDPEAIRSEPDLPDIDEHMDAEVVMQADKLDEAVGAIDMVTDHITFEADPDEKLFRAVGEGDIDETVANFSREELLDAEVEDAAETILSLHYVTDIIDPMPSDAEVRIEFGTEFPAQFRHESVNGTLSVHNIIAPRISTD